MSEIKISWDEEKRIAELYSYDILDTKPELDYDDITYLASWICKTPISLITFVDRKRQWFKSTRGLNVTESPREHAFCAYALASDSPLIVEDTLQDTRFVNNPLVKGPPHIRFYVGLPIVTPSGAVLGTLCVIDQEPKKLTKYQVKALKILSKKVTSLLELKKQKKIVQSMSESSKLNLQNQNKNLHDYIVNLISVGELSQFLTREMNTPLSMILAKTSKIKNDFINSSNERTIDKKDFEAVTRSVEKIDRTLRLLESFSTKMLNEEPRLVNLKSIIDPVIDLCFDRFRNSEIELRILPYRDQLINCKANQMTMALMHLFLHSYNMMAPYDKKSVELKQTEDANFINLEVAYTCNGQDKAIVEFVLSPSYSIDNYPCEGMTLFQAKNIVESHQGQMHYELEPHSAKFVVKLPILRK